MEELDTKPSDYAYVVVHQPNSKFPQRAAQMLGFKPEQVKTGLLAPLIGNTYAGSSLIGLTAILDEAKPGDRVFMVSFGSGAGSDAFSMQVTERILECRNLAPSTQEYIARRKMIDYATYVRYRHKLQVK
jgi:hydroxymethylglutaryl-CoA synthase